MSDKEMPNSIWAHKFTGKYSEGRWFTSDALGIGVEYIRADIAKTRETAAKIEGYQAGMQTASAICIESGGEGYAEAILAELEAANPRPNKAVPLVPDDQRPQGIPW